MCDECGDDNPVKSTCRVCDLCGFSYSVPFEEMDCLNCWPGVMFPGEVEEFGKGVSNDRLLIDWRDTTRELVGTKMVVRGLLYSFFKANDYTRQADLVRYKTHMIEYERFIEKLESLAEFRKFELIPETPKS